MSSSMSSSIYINISNLESGWNPIVGKAQKCTEYIDNSKKYIEIVRDNLDYRIKNKNGIGGRVESIHKSVNEISKQIENIETFLNNSISKYTTAEQRVNQLAIDYGILEPKKKGFEFKWDKEKAWQVGKAVIGIGISLAAVVGAVVTAPATGPLAVVATVSALIATNNLVSSVVNLGFALVGKYDMDYNFLKSVCQWSGGQIGLAFDNKELGTKIGGLLYDTVNLGTMFYNLYGAVKSVNVNSLKQIYKNAVDFVKAVPTKAPQAIGAIKNALLTGKEFLKNSFKSWPSLQQNILAPIWNQVKNVGQCIKTTFNSVNGQLIQKLYTEEGSAAVQKVLGLAEIAIDPLGDSSMFKLSGILTAGIFGVEKNDIGDLVDFAKELRDSDYNFFAKTDLENQVI